MSIFFGQAFKSIPLSPLNIDLSTPPKILRGVNFGSCRFYQAIIFFDAGFSMHKG
jgi:hypothetical protein